MISPNDITLNSYDNHAQQYIQNTPNELSYGLQEWYRGVFANIPFNATIFEIGSASGRDARFIESLGYRVICTDAVDGFVNALKLNGFNATQFNAIHDTFPANLDVVIANAVLVHFSAQDGLATIKKVYDVLASGGRFALTLMEGAGDRMTESDDAKVAAPRYFHYWGKEEIEHTLSEAGFTPGAINIEKSGKWLNIVAVK